MIDYSKDELLELIWTLREIGVYEEERVVKDSPISDTERTLDSIELEGYITRVDGNVSLTDDGEKKASLLIRRHRLAECLLSQLFELEDHHIESSACEFEHILSDKVTESVCTFLGHPPFCPHEKEIPRGVCCKKFRKDVTPLVIRLSDASIGDPYRIIFIMPKQKKRLERLSNIGILPGTVLTLIQKKPSYVLQIGETMIAVDRGIADEIYIKQV
jgi:DtxR family Mn-dependent transcriptional regulator